MRRPGHLIVSGVLASAVLIMGCGQTVEPLRSERATAASSTNVVPATPATPALPETATAPTPVQPTAWAETQTQTQTGPGPTEDPDTGPVAARLASLTFQITFGECLGYCQHILRFDDDHARLSAISYQDDVAIESSARLEPEASAELAALAAAAAAQTLDPVYGCPDCADGGSSTIGVASSSHIYEFGNPPPALAQLDQLLMQTLEALRACADIAMLVVDDGCVPT